MQTQKNHFNNKIKDFKKDKSIKTDHRPINTAIKILVDRNKMISLYNIK